MKYKKDIEEVIKKIDLIDLVGLSKIIVKQGSLSIGEAFEHVYNILEKNANEIKLFDASSTTLPEVIENAEDVLMEIWNTNWWRAEKLEGASFNAFGPSINEVAILKTDASKYFNIPLAVIEHGLYTPKQEIIKAAKIEAMQPVDSDSKPTKWRKAFEYESDGLNALYDLIESYYFDASGNPIYDSTQWTLKKNLESDWLTGRTLDEADTIITSGNRKGKAEK